MIKACRIINLPSDKKYKRFIRIAAAIILLPLASCLQFPTHQGNVLKPAKLADIRVDDSRFHVESVLGTPVLKDDLHPNRAIYVEDYNNEETDTAYQRRVEITYGASGRVKSIKRYGFGNDNKAAGE
ncbi:MAG: outer membrane protein assembly factor BamE [Mariprofundaceae bacterium]|nr:outer membrane protein assembly factor BamE [Mariprofundaceae bacterium]